MFIGLRRKFVSKTLEEIKRRVAQKRIKKFTDLDNVKSLVVLSVLNEEFSLEDLNSFVETFASKGVGVDVVLVNKQKPATLELPEGGNYYVVSRADFRWSGALKNKSVEEVLNKSHDYLIDLTRANSGRIAGIAAQSMAKFKIGIEMFGESVYDLVLRIAPQSSLADFRGQLTYYLGKIC